MDNGRDPTPSSFVQVCDRCRCMFVFKLTAEVTSLI